MQDTVLIPIDNDTVQPKTQTLEIIGFIRDTPDAVVNNCDTGSVFNLIANGDENTLQALLQALQATDKLRIAQTTRLKPIPIELVKETPQPTPCTAGKETE